MCVGWCKYNLKCSATPVDLFFSISPSPPLSPFLLSPLLRPPPPFPLFTPLPLLSLPLLFCLPHPPSYFSSSPSPPPPVYPTAPLLSLSLFFPVFLTLSLISLPSSPPPPPFPMFTPLPLLSLLSLPSSLPPTPDPSLFFPLFTPPLSFSLPHPPFAVFLTHLSSLSPPPPHLINIYGVIFFFLLGKLFANLMCRECIEHRLVHVCDVSIQIQHKSEQCFCPSVPGGLKAMRSSPTLIWLVTCWEP